MYQRNTITIFNGIRISEVFQNAYDSIKTALTTQSEDYILNVNETEYIEYLESPYTLLAPEIHFDDFYADIYEDDIPAEYFPSMMYHVSEGRTYRKEIVQYFIPVSGDIKLLRHRPSSLISIGGGNDFEIRGETIVTRIINFTNNPDDINRSFQNEVNGIRTNYNALIKDIEHFNNGLKSLIANELSQRKQKILNKTNLLASLGVPIKRKENTSSTFSVPKPQLRQKIIVKPIVHEQGFKPEPALDLKSYRTILKLINDVGKNFERMPSIYRGKGEEDLRDHILMTLDPNFELGNASGETFNKTGKTDIRLSYDSSVVFIAECKFWGGEKKYLETIDQLLGYLTWRDTKASIVVFVKQKDFSSILTKVRECTRAHPNHLGYVDNSDENWFNFRFHINDDNNREVKLAVQLFHLPEIKSNKS